MNIVLTGRAVSLILTCFEKSKMVGHFIWLILIFIKTVVDILTGKGIDLFLDISQITCIATFFNNFERNSNNSFEVLK